MRTTSRSPVLLLTILSLVPAFAFARPALALPPGYTLEPVLTGVDFPVALRFAPDGRLFYLERATGRVMTYRSALLTVWATVPVATAGERGLLGLAIHPDFPESAYVYVYHTNPSPLVNRVERIEHAGVGTNPIVFFDGLPAAADFHHGGRLAFGPDRMLYVTFGEQTEADQAQDVNDLRGKIFRLGPGGRPAPGNPFGPDNPAAAYGVRNPFGLCFDPRDGYGYFTENGPECDDEVNFLTLGANYGWSTSDFCGSQPANTYPAITSFTPTIAPTGCCLYRGSGYYGRFDGNLFFGSYNEGNLRRMTFVPGTPDVADTLEVFEQFAEPVLDVTTGSDGLLWVATATTIWRIRPPVVASVDGPFPASELHVAPNPFVRGVAFDLPAGESFERVEILDLAGRQVRAWSAGTSGRLLWDGRDADGGVVSAGVYFLRLTGARGTLSRRLVKLAR
jgi:quinoprotein glucose dehydrogenase